MPIVSRVLVCARAYHTTFLCGLWAGFVEGGVVCVPTLLLEELCVVMFPGAAPAVFKCSGQEVGVVRGVVSYFGLIDN